MYRYTNYRKCYAQKLTREYNKVPHVHNDEKCFSDRIPRILWPNNVPTLCYNHQTNTFYAHSLPRGGE